MFFLNGTTLAAANPGSSPSRNSKQSLQEYKIKITNSYNKALVILNSLEENLSSEKNKDYDYATNLLLIMTYLKLLVVRKIQKSKAPKSNTQPAVSAKILENKLNEFEFILNLKEDPGFVAYINKKESGNDKVTFQDLVVLIKKEALIKDEIKELKNQLYQLKPWTYRLRWAKQHMKLVTFLLGGSLITIWLIIKWIKRKIKKMFNPKNLFFKSGDVDNFEV